MSTLNDVESVVKIVIKFFYYMVVVDSVTWVFSIRIKSFLLNNA